MQTGIFVLTKDITNPHPDRRCSDTKWLSVVTWKKGWKFVIRRVQWRERDFAERGVEVKVYELKWLGYRYASGVQFVERGAGALEAKHWRGEEDEQAAFMELVAALTPSSEKYDEFCWQFQKDDREVRDHADDVLWQLYKAGKVNDADIAAALLAQEADIEREEEEEKAARQRKSEEAAQKGATS